MEPISSNTTRATRSPTSSLQTTIDRSCTTQESQAATRTSSTTEVARAQITSFKLAMTIQAFRVTTEEAEEVKELPEVEVTRTSVEEDTTKQITTNSSFVEVETNVLIRAITRNTRRTVIKVVTPQELLVVAAVAHLAAIRCIEVVTVAGVTTTSTTAVERVSITSSRTI
jgi:hypothetical protein